MTLSQIIAAAIAWTAAGIALYALLEVRRSARNTPQMSCPCHQPLSTVITMPRQLTEAEFEELKARWNRLYGRQQTTGEEESGA